MHSTALHRRSTAQLPGGVAVLLAFVSVASLAGAQGRPDASAAQKPAAPAAAQKPADRPPVARADYVIGAGDVLAVDVFEQPKLTGKYAVQADGTFNFPLINRVIAGGLTVQAVEKDIRDRLAKQFLKDPQLNITVDQYRSQQVIVLGEVRTPQTLEYTGSMQMSEALARVGSVTERAGQEAVIVHQHDPNPTRVNLEQLLAGKTDVSLLSGDRITVLPAERVWVSGQVGRVGEYAFRPGMTVGQLVTIAGGVTDRGSDRRIRIKRTENGKQTEIDAKLGDPVRPGDEIVVRQKLL